MDKRSNTYDERWTMASKIEDLLSKLQTVTEAQQVIINHTLHYDPMDPTASLDSIYDEARKSTRQAEQLKELLAAAWVAIVAQINGIPLELPLSTEEVEELRERLERGR